MERKLTGKDCLKVYISVDCTELDLAIEKAKQLATLLKEQQQMADSLHQNGSES